MLHNSVWGTYTCTWQATVVCRALRNSAVVWIVPLQGSRHNLGCLKREADMSFARMGVWFNALGMHKVEICIFRSCLELSLFMGIEAREDAT